MSIFFNFEDDTYDPFEKQDKCSHERDWDWPQLKKDGDKYKVVLVHHCKKCGAFYNE